MHYLTKDRDARSRAANLEREADLRRREFIKTILLYRYRLERIPHTDPDAVWAAYAEMAPSLLAEAALVEGDFKPVGEFMRLVRRAGEWRLEDANATAFGTSTGLETGVYAKVLRDILRDSLVDVYQFAVTNRPAYFQPGAIAKISE